MANQQNKFQLHNTMIIYRGKKKKNTAKKDKKIQSLNFFVNNSVLSLLPQARYIR